MWFLFALICLLSWGAADLFYKKGTDENDSTSHLKIAVMVGLVMGLFSMILIIFTDASFSFINIIKYIPASSMYILSMIIGYAGLRYLEVSIISPVQNSSGAFSAIVMLVYFMIVGKISSFTDEFDAISIIGTVLICIGVILLAVVEKKLRKDNIENKKYRLGALALIFPLLYCLFDTLGTAADGIILDEEHGLNMSETDVLIAYGITFCIIGVLCWLYMAVFKKEFFNPFKAREKGIAAGFETFGQFFYIYAMAKNPVLSAPMIGSYCIVSIILSRIFLKEKLTKKQYAVISLVIIGILLLGVSEGIAEM